VDREILDVEDDFAATFAAVGGAATADGAGGLLLVSLGDPWWSPTEFFPGATESRGTHDVERAVTKW